MGDRSETETLKTIRVPSITNFCTTRQYLLKNFIISKNPGKSSNGVRSGCCRADGTLVRQDPQPPKGRPRARSIPSEMLVGNALLNTFIASLVSIVAPVFWLGTLLGLPGNWGLVAIAAGLAYFVNDAVYIDIHSPTVGAILALAVFGEVVEFVAGAAGVKQLGGSRCGGALAVLGSVVGAIAGFFIGVPVPVVGSLIAALLFGGAGAFGGAVAGERWSGKDWDVSIRIGLGALCGKVLGTVLKTLCGTVMLVLLLYAVWT